MKKEVSKLAQYDDPSGDFVNRDFRAGLWYVQHKLLLRKIVIGILSTWSTITIGIGLFVWAQYLFVGYWDDEDLLATHINTFQNYRAIQPAYEAVSLSYDTSKIFKSAEGRYDLYTPVTNPNRNFLAHVDFHYVFGQTDTPVQTTTLLPQSTQALIQFGFESDLYPAQARMIVDDIRWQRIDPHAIADIGGYMSERLLFSVEDFSFTRPGEAEGILTNEVAFTLVNNSVYNFWEPTFAALLKRGQSVVGVLPISEKEFRRGESRSVNIYTFAEVTQVDSIELIPLFNLFDRQEYIDIGE
ncbi:MAG: hypothetical protein COU33_02845 [Candidatus Magasanikbacteria bacterium CG10_big_fil_rev_8_21_14_0_10_43_6]|uniref:Uncharacterized protein n=1 Tax=Candidatus Magasanikbacteria bacterium CG10_big_fil_rev_8_21_14_0_10_43_6 TaxID=1974650 RepID=A0A2M6W121_9BACT|nr:MAG: hypothetical protein COU33_02845 [Candidatus Magasanikbacteria bacterium CG10_big_fil_rev_8_21_14_0_10_43_6]